MRWKISAGVLVALALLIPAAPAAAQAEPSGLDASCQTVERTAFKDIRKLVTIDLDTATDMEVRVLANQIMSAVRDNELPVLLPALQEKMDGSEDGLRAFLKKSVYSAWTTDLHIAVSRTMTDAGANVQDAAKKALNGNLDSLLAYLNEDLYAARALDCASQPSASPSVKPSVTPSATTTASPSAGPVSPGGEGGGSGDGGLPVTGANTGVVVGIGAGLLLLGGISFLIARRRRSRFVA